jgi:hypothetical protein
MIQKDTERTRTLRGVGLTPKTLTGLGSPQPTLPTAHNPCPCCRVKADLVPADVAACLGLAEARPSDAPSPRRARVSSRARTKDRRRVHRRERVGAELQAARAPGELVFSGKARLAKGVCSGCARGDRSLSSRVFVVAWADETQTLCVDCVSVGARAVRKKGLVPE